MQKEKLVEKLKMLGFNESKSKRGIDRILYKLKTLTDKNKLLLCKYDIFVDKGNDFSDKREICILGEIIVTKIKIYDIVEIFGKHNSCFVFALITNKV